MTRERLTIVIPVLNEEAVLDRLTDHLRAVLEAFRALESAGPDDESVAAALARVSSRLDVG